jgi:hypothetical protein
MTVQVYRTCIFMKLLYKGGRLHISLNADPAQKIRKNVRYLRISNSERYEKLDRYHPNTTENLVDYSGLKNK